MITNRPLFVIWVATSALLAMGYLCGILPLTVLPQFIAIVLAILTLRTVPAAAQLRRPFVYRLALGLLLASAATVLVAAGSTVYIATPSLDEDASSLRLVGFLVLATSNLVLAILAWRALVRPTPRRAALAGFVAITIELVAMIADVIINVAAGAHTLLRSDHASIALIASFVTTWVGGLASMASLATFSRPDSHPVPDARIV